MPLTNAQYDAVMREYEITRSRHREALQARLAEVYARIPEYRALELSVPEMGVEAAKVIADGGVPDLDALRSRIGEVTKRKQALLEQAGFAPGYPELHYTCPDCQDTGFRGDTRCHCLEDKIRSLLYEQSNLSALITENNFDMMSEAYHKGDDLRRFKNAVSACRKLIACLTAEKGYGNLLFFGTVGSGKSFLSIATAKELLDGGLSVLYFSAVGLFRLLSETAFTQDRQKDRDMLWRDLAGCDVLLIDDLGTELTNVFVSSQLFNLINERHLHRRATIISTNLDFEELRNRYSDRVFSRLVSNYTVCELTGPDIRLIRKAAQTGA